MIPLLVILAIALAMRVLFVVSSGSDRVVHQWIIRRCRQQGYRFAETEDSLIPGVLVYPQLWHYLCAQLPRRRTWLISFLLIALLDTLTVAGVYVGASLFLPQDRLNWPLPAPFSPAVAVAALYALLPLFMTPNARIRESGTRVPGYVLGLGYLLVLGVALLGGGWWGYVLAGVLSVLIVHTSQFASQAIYGFAIVLSIAYFTPFPAIATFGSILLMLCVPGSKTRNLLHQRLAHWRWYITNQKTFTAVASRNKPSAFLRLPVTFVRTPRRALSLLFFHCSPFILLYCTPPLVVLLYWLAVGRLPVDTFLADPWLGYAFWVTVASLGMFVLTSLRPLLFLGEAERYVEFAGWAICLLFVASLGNQHSQGGDLLALVLFLLAAQIVVVVVNFLLAASPLIRSLLRNETEEGLAQLIDYLRTDPGRGIATIPAKLGFELSNALPDAGKKFYFNMLLTHDRGGFSYMNRAQVQHEYIRPDFETLAEEFGVDTVVADKAYVHKAAEERIDYGLEHRKPVFENRRFAVYRVQSAKSASAQG